MPPFVNGSSARTPDMSWVKKLTWSSAGMPLARVITTTLASASPTSTGAATTAVVTTRSATTVRGWVRPVRTA